ncbi:MAG TPA: replication-associated recombination protein A [Coxiellaceae bacterium]|nr:replication-associated recombination protein A [Coxiellaceae bacterium]
MIEPLASRLRPRDIAEYVGQAHLLAPNKPLRLAIERKRPHSMILWGPPGVGKTSLAYLLAHAFNARVEQVSAVLIGVKEIREIVKRAEEAQAKSQQATILFVDEVHRFNKTQQDAFLPHVEAGTLILIGATTENPSFQINNALLSRTRVYVLKALTRAELLQVIHHAMTDKERGLGQRNLNLAPNLAERIVDFADGDARKALNALEIVSDFVEDEETVTEEMLEHVLSSDVRRFDNRGDLFYEQISALHKSLRGSDPDAALYWFCRMLEAGCDPHYIARRLLRFASEDVGNADPRALSLCLEAWQSYERLGSPEGDLALAQAVLYLAVAAKSNASYVAFNAALKDASQSGSLDVPLHLRNAPTKLMKELEYGKDYRYAHNEQNAFAAGESYFPEGFTAKQYYHPVNRGLEIQIAEKLKLLKKLNKEVNKEEKC